MTRTFRADIPLQALPVEQTLLLAPQPEQAADAAPDGPVLARVEAGRTATLGGLLCGGLWQTYSASAA